MILGKDVVNNTHTKAITIKMRVKRQATEREKIFAKPLSDQGLISKVCKQLL